MSFFKRLKEGLRKTSSRFSKSLKDIFTHKKLTAETLDELEDLLITSDLSIHTTTRILEAIKAQKYEKDIPIEEVKKIIASEVIQVLSPCIKELTLPKESPAVVLVVGVNGTGKTTTIAKLAKHFQDQKKKVHLAAGDTFRAAAMEQLAIWGKRLDIPTYTGAEGSDPASIAYQAYQHAQSEGADILFIDTAGRLHNKQHLMDELSKIMRVLQKLNPTLPHEIILVLDATTGQNALSQVEIFLKTVPLSGLIMTKLDGTARGGIVVTLAERLKLPIYAIGVGEGFEDLQPFDAENFAYSLVGLEETTSNLISESHAKTF